MCLQEVKVRLIRGFVLLINYEEYEEGFNFVAAIRDQSGGE
jgi:hypothetical protein